MMMDREEKARRAKELLDDPVLSEALDTIRGVHTSRWASTSPEDTQGREICWHRLKAVDDLREEIRSVARGLEVEAHNRRINNR